MSQVIASRITAVVVTYRSADVIAQALTSLTAAGVQSVVVVDNASPDNTLEAAADAATADTTVISCDENFGFGAGCNRGASAAPHDAEFLLFLNPDASIERGSLMQLVSYLDRHPRCALTAPRLRWLGQPSTSSGAVASTLSELRYVLPGPLARLTPDRRHPSTSCHAGPVGYVEGACMLFRRQAFEQVSGFDEAFFLFFEEMDVATRLRARGWTVDICCEAWAEHEGGASRVHLPAAGREHYFESTVRFLRHHRGPRAARAYVLLAELSWRGRAALGRVDKTLANQMCVASRAGLQEA